MTRLHGKTAQAVDTLKREGGALLCANKAEAERLAHIHGGKVVEFTTEKGAALHKPAKSTWAIQF